MCASALTLRQSETKESKFDLDLDPIIEPYSCNIANRDLLATSDTKILEKRGYRKLNKICDSLQGEIFKALNLSTGKFVAIKKTNKSLFNDCLAIEDDMTFCCVSENVVKEAAILHHLTVNNLCIGGYIIQYIDFFESNTDYYLVTEYIESELNMRQFVKNCYQSIKQGKLDLREYLKMIKYLYWQLSVTIEWLHDSMHCTHLDLDLSNIMVSNGKFIIGRDGKYKLDKNISIKLIDFGVSERFHVTSYNGFKCNKQNLTLENLPYLAPKVYSDHTYNGKAADMWSLGMILYEMLTAKRLYKPYEIWECKATNVPMKHNAYYSLYHNRLGSFIANHNKYSIFKTDSFDLLNNLLRINEEERYTAMNVLQHKWFKSYYKSYRKQIEKKRILEKQKLEKQKHKSEDFPFYSFIKFNADNIV